MGDKAAGGGTSTRRRRGGQQEETPYVKYLKYKSSGFTVSSNKTTVWIPSADKEKVYEIAEVIKDDGKTFTYRSADGQVYIYTSISLFQELESTNSQCSLM